MPIIIEYFFQVFKISKSYPKAEVRACYSFDKNGALQGPITPEKIFTALAAGAAEQPPPYDALTVPAPAIYAVADVAEDMFRRALPSRIRLFPFCLRPKLPLPVSGSPSAVRLPMQR